MNREAIRKYIVFIVGTFIFAFSISLSNKSLLGCNSMATLVTGIYKNCRLDYGTCNLLVGIVEIVVGYIFDKKNVTVMSLVGLFCCSYLIDLANLIVVDTGNLFIRIIYMLAGTVLFCLGLAIQQYSKCGYGNLDCFLFGLKRAFRVNDYHTIKWVVDISFIVVGYLLGAVVGVGTIVMFLFTGLLVENFLKLLNKTNIMR
ncbi:MAG: hypothetical protein Q4E33_02910 [Erysipelotrichaceae bacterium]|nr:hypothetical protein [Erysipelotrichaceae bacterium]